MNVQGELTVQEVRRQQTDFELDGDAESLDNRRYF